MESRNECEKAKLKLELERLRVSSPMEIPNVSVEEQGLELGTPASENDPYQVMKSIAFEPFDFTKRRARSFNIKDITGGGRELPPQNVNESSTSARALTFSPPPSPTLPSFSPEIPLLSPATGQHNTVSQAVTGSPIDSHMKELLATYEVVGDDANTPVDAVDGTCISDLTASCTVDLGYVSRNMPQFQVDNDLSKSCPQHEVDFSCNNQPDNLPAHRVQ